MESVLHDDDVRSGHTTDTIRVPDQKVHNYRSDSWITLKFFSRDSGGSFTWSSVKSVLHDNDVRSAPTTDPTRVPNQKVDNSRSDRWTSLKKFSRVSGGCFTWSSVESVCPATDIVRSGHTTDTIRVSDQKGHNYRSDRWIALKFFSRVSGGCFTWSSVESVLHNDDVRSGHTTDMIRVSNQKGHNYRSDHWIALKYFSRVSGGCFTWSRVESIYPTNDIVRSAPTTDPTKVPDQKVHNDRSERWIALKLFALVSEGCFTWSSVESVLHNNDVRSGHTTDTIRVADQKVHNYRSDRWIALKFFSRVSGGCFTWSSVESICPATNIIRRAIQPTRSEYRIKSSITIDPTVGSL